MGKGNASAVGIREKGGGLLCAWAPKREQQHRTSNYLHEAKRGKAGRKS